jgi:ssDNA-binding Zn-finger/Zn-ribbon topoisomerase 1
MEHKASETVDELSSTVYTIDITKMIWEIEGEIAELNDFNWFWGFSKPDTIKALLEEAIDQIDFYQIDYATNLGFYWCGILTAEPWCELYEEEETILNVLLHKHTELVIDDGNLVLRFKQNPDSLCHPVFRDYPGGYGGNIPHSVNDMLLKVEEIIRKTLKDSIADGGYMSNKWGEWGQEYYCDNCDECHIIMWSEPYTHCPHCGHEFGEEHE